MNEKYVHWLQGAAGGAIALAVVGFSWGGWYTSKGADQHAQAAVLTTLIPACAKEVMADPTAAAELQVKRKTDFDDIVRDYRKRTASVTDLGYQFNRDCGKAIEAIMAKTATKS
jgi:alpha/beta superfamily hydrolase